MIYRVLLSILGFVGIKCYQYDKIVQCHPLEMCTLKHGAKSGCHFFFFIMRLIHFMCYQ